ncbi:MAG: hypothetical protein WD558_03410 [Pseudomonadales bacterium]
MMTLKVATTATRSEIVACGGGVLLPGSDYHEPPQRSLPVANP